MLATAALHEFMHIQLYLACELFDFDLKIYFMI